MIGLLVELPELSSAESARIIEDLNLGGKPPRGQIFHAEGPMEGGGTRVVDVWESREALDAFLHDHLGSIFRRRNIALPRPTIWPIAALLR